MKYRELPPAEYLRECLDYDPETGTFRWRWRPDHHFPLFPRGRALNWNSHYAGKPAFITVSKGGYYMAHVTYRGVSKNVTAGRVAWKMLTGKDPPQMIDHRNGDPSDNRAVNLRLANAYENARNRLKVKDRGGIPKGVFRAKGGVSWSARIGHKGQNIYIGSFATIEEAFQAHCDFGRALRGEFFNPGANWLGVFA
jgi:hypothetical protein